MILELGGQTRHSGHIHCMSIGGLPFQVLRLSAERHFSEWQKGVAEQASCFRSPAADFIETNDFGEQQRSYDIAVKAVKKFNTMLCSILVRELGGRSNHFGFKCALLVRTRM